MGNLVLEHALKNVRRLQMSTGRVSWIGVAASALTGAVCSLVLPLIVVALTARSGEDTSGVIVYLLLAWVVVGLWLGVAAGVVLGVVPMLVAVYLWSGRDGDLDPRRGIGVTGLAVGLVATAEVVFPFVLHAGAVSVETYDSASTAPTVGLALAVLVGLVSGGVFALLMWLMADWTAEDESQPTWPPVGAW